LSTGEGRTPPLIKNITKEILEKYWMKDIKIFTRRVPNRSEMLKQRDQSGMGTENDTEKRK
jgi:hypothetical protein